MVCRVPGNPDTMPKASIFGHRGQVGQILITRSAEGLWQLGSVLRWGGFIRGKFRPRFLFSQCTASEGDFRLETAGLPPVTPQWGGVGTSIRRTGGSAGTGFCPPCPSFAQVTVVMRSRSSTEPPFVCRRDEERRCTDRCTRQTPPVVQFAEGRRVKIVQLGLNRLVSLLLIGATGPDLGQNRCTPFEASAG